MQASGTGLFQSWTIDFIFVVVYIFPLSLILKYHSYAIDDSLQTTLKTLIAAFEYIF